VGRHAASDGSAVHPLVAEGLARRADGDAQGAHRDEPPSPREGGLGWPAPPNRGRGLGWPGDLAPDPRAHGDVPSRAGDDVPPSAGEEPPVTAGTRRRGWRRLFGSRAA
jgi:hypothetical protein